MRPCFSPILAFAMSIVSVVSAQERPPIIDVHMHVWSDDPVKFPFAHPYDAKFVPPKIPASLDRVVKEMDEHGVTHCVLVQTISHGWDNRYLFHCLKAEPKRFRGQGLIDPTDPDVAKNLALVMKEPGMAGVRFSPMYYQGKDDWLNAKASDAVWEKAAELGAVFNFFIASEQLPKLEDMVRRHPRVKVVIDHLARVDLEKKDPEPEIKKLLALAKYPNVYVKISELMILSPSKKFPYRDTFSLVKKVYDAFGPDRLLWGTGFPGATREQADRPTLAKELALIKSEIPFFTAEDRTKILGRNAAKLWGFTDDKKSERRRVIIETDAGGDPDDEQSLVRFLLYANEFDIAGIICTRPKARDKENLNTERAGLGIVRRQLKAYGECYPNLVKHESRFPTMDYLWQRTVAGYEGDAGVKLILAAADSSDPRPIWLCNWGTDKGSAESSLKLALDRVLKERGESGYAKFKSRFRLSSADRFGDHTFREPAWPIWVDTFRPELEGKRWYHRFSALTAKAGGFDVKRDVLTGHGPLGALYPTNTGLSPQKEGDTMSFLYLVPTGMNDPLQPKWGSWGGRYGLNEKEAPRPHYWANQKDHWEGTTHRDNTLKRWAINLQNDFRARLNWCVEPPKKANHPPRPICQADDSSKIIFADAAAGKPFRLSAQGTLDPDGDCVDYRWYVYSEAGTYSGQARIADDTSPQSTLFVPADAAGRTIHVILEVTDHGEPRLSRYRRVVVQAK